MKAIIDNKIEKLAEISTVNATQKIKESRGRSYGLRSLEKWTLEQVPTRARGQLPFNLFQTVLRSIPNSLFL